MTNIFIIRDSEENIIEFTFVGHANYAKLGEDIVCAALSTLSQFVTLGLSGIIGIDIELVERSGYLSCKLMACNEVQRIQANAMLETMRIFVETLAKQYPQNIYVRIMGGSEESGN